jgi:hypothetical protein
MAARFMDERMAYNSKRLLLRVVLKGLADAIRRNDRSTAERYHRRLRLTAEQIAADELVQDALKRVLLVSGLWVEAAEVDRNETTQQLLKLIDRVIGLLTS